MVRTFLTPEKIVNGEEKLQSFLDANGQIDWAPQMNEALQELINDLISSGYMVRQLCIALEIQASTTEAGTLTGSKSDEDNIQRQVLVVEATEVHADEHSFTLQGTNDDSSETWIDINSFGVTETGDTIIYLDTLYKYYRLNKTDSNSCIYSSSLYERVYETLHLFKARAKIYNNLVSIPDDVYGELRDHNNERYNAMLENTRFMYDKSDDGKISDGEAEENYNTYDISL